MVGQPTDFLPFFRIVDIIFAEEQLASFVHSYGDDDGYLASVDSLIKRTDRRFPRVKSFNVVNKQAGEVCV